MYQPSKLFLAIMSIGLASQANASDFSLPFVNSAGLGVAYADWATAAADASTAYTNPAGLVKLKNKQFVFNALGIFGDAKFTGTSVTPSFPFPAPVVETRTAKSPIGNFSPSIYYAAPLSDRFSFGFNITAPFGLGTNYPNTSIVRYAATRSQVAAIDIGPSLAAKITDNVSVGVGVDAVHLGFQLNNMYGPPLSQVGPTSFADQTLENKLQGWGYGFHAGALVDVAPTTRLGVSVNTRVAIETNGHSTVYLPNNQELTSRYQVTKAALPARVQLSAQHEFNKRWTGMFTAFYTNWSTFNHITMESTMTPLGFTLPVTIPFNYTNCWDYSVGASFKSTEKLLLRGGLQILNTPSNNHDRGVADPIGNATIVTIGAHYQQSEALSYDVGLGHSFFKQMPVNFANQLTSLSGHTNTQTTVLGAQLNWTIA